MFPSFQVWSRPLKNQHGENPHLILSSVASKFSCFVASWQSVKKAPFVFSWANSTTLPNLQQESLHVRRLLVQPEQQLLHVERKWNQTRCLPTAQNHLLREQKDHSIQTIHPSGTPHETRRLYFPERTTKRIWGYSSSTWTFLTAQDTLGCQARPGTRRAPAVLAVGNTERLKFPTTPAMADSYQRCARQAEL